MKNNLFENALEGYSIWRIQIFTTIDSFAFSILRTPCNCKIISLGRVGIVWLSNKCVRPWNQKVKYE